MPSRKPILIASDVDGTLLDDDEKVSPRTRATVSALVADGANFILATGRPPRLIAPVVDGLGFAPLAVCGNGAVLYDSAQDRVISARALDVETLDWIAELAYRALPGCGLAAERVGDRAHDAATPQFVSAPDYEHAWLNPDNTQVSVQEVLSAPAIKLLIRLPNEHSEQMRATLAPLVGDRADITYSTNKGLIEVSAPGVTKASGVRAAAERLGSAESTDIIAFGDMPNDVPLLEYAGRGVAMGHGHPDALAVADEITATNNEDGVARVLERWWQ
ncbi:MAG: HAD family hydrolase [Aldersonia sp.]|nr:HAD family hydrolase [Aldersonia sp.]